MIIFIIPSAWPGSDTARNMAPRYRQVMNTKACLAALGLKKGLSAIAEAGFSEIVVWSGNQREYLGAVRLAGKFGLSVLAVALPKMPAFSQRATVLLSRWMSRMVSMRVPAVSLIFADSTDEPVAQNQREALYRFLRSVNIPVFVENNGRQSERFSNPRELAELLANVPSLSLVVDLGHLASAGCADCDLSMLGGKIAWVDVHDNNGFEDLHLPLGQGSGKGSFVVGLRRLQSLPGRIVIETDARLGSNRSAWVESLRTDRIQLTNALSGRMDLRG
jgi:hypothetical protein